MQLNSDAFWRYLQNSTKFFMKNHANIDIYCNQTGNEELSSSFVVFSIAYPLLSDLICGASLL